MIKSLSVGKKFLLIALVSLIPLVFSTALWFMEIGKQVDNAVRERSGLAFHASLRAVLEGVVKHRDASVQMRSGNEAAKQSREAAVAQTQQALAAAEALARERDADTLKALKAIATSWDVVQRGSATRSAEETLTEQSELITYSLLPLMSDTGRVSGLNVDSQPASYYLVRIAVERLPLLIAHLSEARSLATIVAKRGQLAPQESDQLRALSVLAQSDLDAIDADTKSLYKVDPEIKPVLEGPFQDYDKRSNAFLRNLEGGITGAKSGNLSWTWVSDSDKSIEASFTAYDRARQSLAGQLGERLDELANQRNLLIGVNLGVIGLAAVFGFLLMRSVRTAITRALQVADRVAAGDLTHAIDVQGDDETARLMQALKSMNQSLSKMVGEVRASADSITNEVHQIVQGNRDLSQRTESQASAIEETASSMEELTASVRQNMDSAKETERIATQAGDASRRGYEAVNQVVVHMASIQQGTKKVGEIVALIDSIAFQTNILALNAAVEAARAGEQGRGFAVVAGEVRNLAKRCAESAREIRGLINTSNEQVAEGGKLVDEVAETIGDINGRVSQVNTLMNQIVSASSEQSSGIEQVNQTIAQMEKVTQQNAALVEQVLAATEALTEQTARMSGLVSVFTLHQRDETGGGNAPARGKAVPVVDTKREPTLVGVKGLRSKAPRLTRR